MPFAEEADAGGAGGRTRTHTTTFCLLELLAVVVVVEDKCCPEAVLGILDGLFLMGEAGRLTGVAGAGLLVVDDDVGMVADGSPPGATAMAGVLFEPELCDDFTLVEEEEVVARRCREEEGETDCRRDEARPTQLSISLCTL